jgi:hypothetical protein
MIMKRLVLALPLLLLANCAPVNPRLQAPLKERGRVEMKVAEQNQELNTKIDILFVIDNSKSMTDEQLKLAGGEVFDPRTGKKVEVKGAIDHFVAAFAKNTTLDFHIGVTTVFDSIKYGKPGRKITPNGYLWPVVDPQTKQRLPNEVPYATRNTPNYSEVLRETLRVGVMNEVEGPVSEEAFAPALAAVADPAALQANRGFYRGDAYLLLIFVTDAEDATLQLSPTLLRSTLVQMKGDASKVMAHAATWTPNCGAANQDPDHKAPTKIHEFVQSTDGSVFSLCEADYGASLAKIGIETTRRISRRVINLNAVPDINTLEVKYGSQTIPADFDHGWTLDPDRTALILSGDLTLHPEPGAQLTIRFVPLDYVDAQNGRTNIIGK